MSVETKLPPFRNANYLERKLHVERRDDGSIVMRNLNPLLPVPENIIAPLRKWAAEAPDRTWLAMRGPSKDGKLGEWNRLTYAEANARINAIAEGLLARGLNQQTPLMILSGNSIEHALMTYGAILAGVPAVPVSPAYSTMSTDFDKLKHVFGLIEPKMIFMQTVAPFERGLAALNLDGVELVTADGSRGTAYADLVATTPTEAVEPQSRSGGEISLHLRLHRHAQSRYHDNTHDVRELSDAQIHDLDG